MSTTSMKHTVKPGKNPICFINSFSLSAEANRLHLKIYITSLRDYLHRSKQLERKITQVAQEYDLEIENRTAGEHMVEDVEECLMQLYEYEFIHTDHGRYEGGSPLATHMDCYPSSYRVVLGVSTY